LGNDFWAALMGAIVGGGFTMLAQWYSSINQFEQLRKDKNDEIAGSLVSLIVKSMSIHGQLVSVHQYINERIERNRQGKDLFLQTESFVNIPKPISIIESEIFAVFSVRNNRIMGDMFNIQNVYSTMIDLMSHYNELRKKLYSLRPAGMDGDETLFNLSDEQLREYEPVIYAGNAALNQLNEFCQFNSELYGNVIAEFSASARVLYDTKFSTGLPNDFNIEHWTKRLYG
jgi:hypothetical protein